jgi:hypothetical protein
MSFFLLAEGDTVGDQSRNIGCSKANARCWLAIVFDVRELVEVMRKSARQGRIVGMGLRVVPTDGFFASQDIVIGDYPQVTCVSF